jgi:RHS repeat-associated protein
MKSHRRFWRSVAACVSLSVLLLGSTAQSQVGPVGADHTSVGPGAGHVSPVSPTGGYATAVPLALPPARGGLPVPLAITYTGTSQAGAAGIGWDVPLSYVRRSVTTWHRKPAAASSSVFVPERIILALGGLQQLMVPSAQPNVWLPLLGDEYTELRRNADDTWTLSTASGVDYVFESTQTDLWLLAEVRDRVGTDRVELEYAIAEGRVPELTRLRYGFAGDLPLYEVALKYRIVRKPIAEHGLYTWPGCSDLDDPIPGAAPSPDTECRVFGNVDLEGELFRRSRVLGQVVVLARNNLAPTAAARAIRTYDFGYSDDVDTGAPRLSTVDVSGEAGALTLPVSRYRYGAVDEAGVTFQPAQVIPIDPAAMNAGVNSLAASTLEHDVQDFDPTLIDGLSVDTVRSRHLLRDFTGDLIPDLVYKSGDTWRLRRGVLTPDGFSLEDGPSTSWSQPSELHMERTLRRINVGIAANRQKMVTTETLVTFEDWNGDARTDIIDARTGDPNRWDVWLNLPAADGTIEWSRRDVYVSELVDHIEAHDLQLDLYFDTDWTPIERTRSWPKFVDFACFDQTKWSDGSVDSEDCEPDDPISVTEDRVVDTVGEWALTDQNGDGYPDLVANTVPVTEEECETFTCDEYEGSFPTRCEVDEGWTAYTNPETGQTRHERECVSLHKQWLTLEGNQIAVLLNRAGALVSTAADAGYEATILPYGSLGVSRFSASGDYSNEEHSKDISAERPVSLAGFVDLFGLGRPSHVSGYGRFDSNQHEVCTPDADPGATFTSTQISGRADLNGDATPDQVFRDDGGVWKVRFGTSSGLGPARSIASAVPFAISENQGTCVGTSSTVAGLVDLDGDGRPEMVRYMGGQFVAAKLTTADGGFGIAAGRLIEIDNGYGASTRITYANNKTDLTAPHDVPVPEVVVSQTQVLVDDGSAPNGEPVRFAYGTPEMRYDPALNRLQFAGYRRQVTLVGAEPRCDGGLDCLVDGYAIVVDRAPQALPGAGFEAMALGGRIAKTTRLEGLFLPDARPILDLDVYAGYRRAQSVHEYQVTELPVAPWSSGTLGQLECIDVEPHTGTPFLELSCHRSAIVNAVVDSNWEGLETPDQGLQNVYTGSAVLESDERGRPIEVVDYGDLRTIADDRCTTLQYAIPEPGFSLVTSVVAGVWITDCGWNRATGGVSGLVPGDPMFLSVESFRYDDLPEGRVGRGRPTSRIVEIFDMATGESLGEHVAASLTYDELGQVREAVASRSLGTPATRTSTFVYDAFGASVQSVTERASDVAPTFQQNMVASTWPSVSHEVHGVNGERTVTDRDAFGRATRTRIVALGTDHVVSTTAYDDAGREITRIGFPATASLPQRSHVHLDALGRPRFEQTELGQDYGATTVVSGLVEYDSLGRAIYQADPFEWPELPFAAEDLPADETAWPHGRSFVYDGLGRLNRTVEAQGQRPTETVTNVGSNVFVSDVRYTWADGQAVVKARGPSENALGVPSSGVETVQRMTGLGWSIEEARVAPGGARLDLVRRTFDRFGREAQLLRYRDAQNAANPVTWTRRRDSRGLVLQLTEPGTTTAYSDYDEWGALLESEWLDGTTLRRTRNRYDGLGRPISLEVLNSPQSGSPEFIEFSERYHYDFHSGAPIQPSSALMGRLSRIQTIGTGDAYFGYDALGRQTSEVSLLSQHGSPMGTKRTYHPGGALSELRFETTVGVDRIGYVLDSAARVRRITDLNFGTDLLRDGQMDAEGRYKSFRLGNGVVEEFKYAPTGRQQLQNWSITTASGIQVHDFLSRDAENRLLTERYNQQGFTFDVTHEYDALDRLIRSAALTTTPLASQDERFTYDDIGNFKTKRNLFNSSLDRDYSVDPLDPDRVCRFVPAGQNGIGCSFLYDGAGNVKSDTWSGTRTYTYDSSSRIVGITKGAWRAEFLYGPGGALARTEVRNNGSLDRRIWRFGDLIEERRRPNGAIQVERRIPGPLGIVATLRTQGGTRETIYVHGEGRGNKFFTRSDGTLSQQVRYRAFGSIIANTGQPTSLTYSDDLWNGGDDLPELGVTILGSRVYDPHLGRFLQRDPIVLRNSATRGNPYSFSYNDPTNYSDPSGLCVESGCVDWAFDVANPIGLLAESLRLAAWKNRRENVTRKYKLPDLRSIPSEDSFGRLFTGVTKAGVSLGGSVLDHLDCIAVERAGGLTCTGRAVEALAWVPVHIIADLTLFTADSIQNGLGNAIDERLRAAGGGDPVEGGGVYLGSWIFGRAFGRLGPEASGGLATTLKGPPMDAGRFARMKAAFERAGGVIDQSDEAVRYLDSRGAEALTFNSTTILLRPNPSASAVFEEFIHVGQFRKGLADSSSVTALEIDAAERLMRNQRAWGITPSEAIETAQRLRNLKGQ